MCLVHSARELGRLFKLSRDTEEHFKHYETWGLIRLTLAGERGCGRAEQTNLVSKEDERLSRPLGLMLII